MNNKITKRIFVSLFALLYISVALVSTYHAVYFFGLANVNWIAVMLAITFEIGQAAVLFSILTNTNGKRNILPWILMVTLTLVQVLGNVYSSYKYLITNSESLLRYFKEPIFVWMDLPDAQANVILTYIIGAILPIVSLLMTGMVTSYLEKSEQDEIPEKTTEDKTEHVNEQVSEPTSEPTNETIDEPVDVEKQSDDSETNLQELLKTIFPKDSAKHTENENVETVEDTPQEPKEEQTTETPEEEQITETKPEQKRKSHFINI